MNRTGWKWGRATLRLVVATAVLVTLAALLASMFDGADRSAASWVGPDPAGRSWGD